MTKLASAAMVFSALPADGSARAQDLDNPTPGQLLNEDYLTSTARPCRGQGVRRLRVHLRATVPKMNGN
jgi:hypothetical protein